MGCGTPVIVSNTSAIPEVAGEGALYTDPYNEQDIANKLLLIEKDKEMYQKLVEYGRLRVNSFSWEWTAKNLVQIYSSL